MLLACLLLLCRVLSFAQNQNTDLLRNSLQKSHADTTRVNLQLQLSTYYSNTTKPSPRIIDSVMVYAKAAERLSTTLNYPKGLGNSYMALAKAYLLKKDSSDCNANVRKAIAICLKNQLNRGAAEAWLKLEEYYQTFGGTDLNVRAAYYEQAHPLFQKAHAYDRQEATLKILGDFYQVQGNFPKAMERLQQAFKLVGYVQSGDKESLYDLLGAVHTMLGNLNKALEYGLLAVKITEQTGDNTLQACAVYNRVGMTYYNMRNYNQAIVFYKKSLAIAVKQKDIQAQINEHANIAQVLITLGRFKECIALLKNVEKKYPPAELSQHLGIDLGFLKCYVKLKQFAEARVYCDRLEIAALRLDQNDNYQQIIQSIVTEYYVATVQDKPARKHLAFLKKLSIQQHNPVALALAYLHACKLDSAESNFASALKNYKLASTLRDSVYSERQNKQIAQLQIQFDIDKKDQDLMLKEDRIKLLNNQGRLQQVNLNQEKLTQKLIIGGAVLLAILLGLSYNSYRVKQRVNRQLQAQRTEIEHKNESLTKLVNEKDNLLGEKEWLMKEIHHRVKNNLQIVISLLSTQSNYLDNDIAYNAIRESQHRMQSISLIHQKLYQSDNLALVDIHSYIADLVAYLRDSFDTGTRIEFELDVADAEFDVTRSVPLGLILNEAITNAIKYAFPNGHNGKISISLKPDAGNAFKLTIHDNGIGFPTTVDIAKSKSLGMSLMRGLSKQLGGSLKVDNGDGITITVDFINEKLLKEV